MIKVVEKKKIWFSISLTVILVGLVLLFTRGLNFGIDFKGGTKLQVELGEKLDTAALDEIINKYDSSASCKIVNDTQYEIKSTVLDETTSSELLNEIEETFELDDTALVEQNQIGGAVGKELTRKSLIAVGVACVAVLVYTVYQIPTCLWCCSNHCFITRCAYNANCISSIRYQCKYSIHCSNAYNCRLFNQ